MNRQFHGALLGSALTLLAIAAQPALAVETIDFENTGCRTGSSSFCEIPDTYGDTFAVEVSYASVNIRTGERIPVLYRYGVGYGDLQGVVFGGRNRSEYASEIRLEAKSGFELSLLDFDFASFAGRSPTTPFVIQDLAGTVISEGTRSTAWPTHGNYVVNGQFGSGFIIRWGPDGYEVGLDNIRYDVSALSGAVPEPTTWAMLILGFGLVGSQMRRRAASPTLAIA